VREKAPEVLDEIRETKDLSDESIAKLDGIIPGVVDQFAAPEEKQVPEEPAAEEAEEEAEAAEEGEATEEKAEAAA
jgi:hypothetical protein